jgi:hypothetical protein
MTMTAEELGLTRDDAALRRHVEIDLSELAYEALTGDDPEAAVPVRIESAVRCYLEDRDADRQAWPYPDFLRGSETRNDVRVELEVVAELWRDFAAEAVRQEVTVEQLAEHASFYLAAELNAGRVTARILEDFESSEGSGAGG